LKIVWTKVAEQRLRDAVELERRERPLDAFNWFQRLMQQVGVLDHREWRGTLVPELERLEVAEMQYEAYRVIYRPEAARVVILTLRSARKESHQRKRYRNHYNERPRHGERDRRPDFPDRMEIDVQAEGGHGENS
jgi:hypothetical protein